MDIGDFLPPLPNHANSHSQKPGAMSSEVGKGQHSKGGVTGDWDDNEADQLHDQEQASSRRSGATGGLGVVYGGLPHPPSLDANETAVYPGTKRLEPESAIMQQQPPISTYVGDRSTLRFRPRPPENNMYGKDRRPRKQVFN